MDVGGIIASALGGGARAVQGMAQGYIEDERKVNVAKELAAAEEQKALRMEAARLKMGEDAAQRGRDRVRDTMGGKTGPEAVEALTQAGDLASAASVADMGHKGVVTTPYGSITKGPGGQVITDNSVQRAEADRLRATGGGRKPDHFDEKQWDEARKPEKGWFTVVDDTTGKETYLPQLSEAFLTRFTQLKGAGGMTPEVARAKALNFANGLQERAEALLQSDEGKGMNLRQAISLVQRRLNEAPVAPGKQPGAPAGKGAPARGAPAQGAAPAPPKFDPLEPFRKNAAAGNKDAQAFLDKHAPAPAPRSEAQDLEDAARFTRAPAPPGILASGLKGRERIAQRVQEAKSGGQPLNAVEQLLARQHGLL